MSAKDLNKVLLCGRLTRDAELKSAKNGNPCCLFAIAVNRSKDATDYFDIEMWGKNASAIHPFLSKGKQVLVDGNLKQQVWEKDGQKRYRIVVWADNVQMLGGGEKPHSDAGNAPETKPNDGLNGPESFDDSDCPF